VTTFRVTASTMAPSTRMVKRMPTTTTMMMPWTLQRRLLRRLRCSRSGPLFCAFHSSIHPSTHSLAHPLSPLAHSLTTHSSPLTHHSLTQSSHSHTHPFTHLLRQRRCSMSKHLCAFPQSLTQSVHSLAPSINHFRHLTHTRVFSLLVQVCSLKCA
jgi:hypothetical protein